jgi:alkane 1-monooxygenase
VTATDPTPADETTAGTDALTRATTRGRVRRWTGRLVGPDGQVWRDRKRYLWALGIVVPLLPFAARGQVENTGWTVFWWMGPIWILIIVPVLDALLGADPSNPPEWAVPQLDADRWYRWLTYLYLPLQYLGLVWAAWYVAHHDMSAWSQLGFALTVGTVAGVGINTAHELGHKRDRLERRLSKVALAQTGYGHFYVEHNRGHHSRVSTPEDPASARLGESFWRFLPRTVVGSVRSAWDIAATAQRRRGERVWSLRNDVLNAWLLSLALFGGLVAWLGPTVVPFLVVQAVFGFCLLEVVNYIEHYGLLRQRVANGRYGRCRPAHSWNSNHRVSNLVLYHLERHSDHHANPTRRYQSLRHFDDAPQLPSGYALMICLAAVPPLWRRVMDPRVLDHYDGDVTLANIEPTRRDQVLARYGAPA